MRPIERKNAKTSEISMRAGTKIKRENAREKNSGAPL